MGRVNSLRADLGFSSIETTYARKHRNRLKLLKPITTEGAALDTIPSPMAGARVNEIRGMGDSDRMPQSEGTRSGGSNAEAIRTVSLCKLLNTQGGGEIQKSGQHPS